jgi:amidase
VTQIHDLSATELVAAIRRGEISPLEVTDHYLDRIDRLNSRMGAYLTVTADLARDQARQGRQGQAREAQAHGPLHGLPVPIKDLNRVAGVPNTLGSAVYADFVAPIDDHVVTRLRDAGTILLGKTNTPEFGLPCYTENVLGPPARTPWDLSRSAGGSSGGAAAAVAAGLAPVAHGSDGGGSIRIPASVCGLFGLKPSRGRIGVGPVVPDLFGMSTSGPIARTVADAAALLDVMVGTEPGDLYALATDESFSGAVGTDPPTLRIGRNATPLVPGATVHPDCLEAYEDASRLLEDLGHVVEDVEFPLDEGIVPHFEVLWAAMSMTAPVAPEQEELLAPLTRWLRERGAALKATDLMLAQAMIQAAARRVLPVLDQYDAILQPTLARPPAPIGHFSALQPAENFEEQKHFTPFTSLYNLLGLPAVSLPLQWTEGGLPIGVMLAGRMGDEAGLISLSAQVEAARPWRDRHPDIWGE